MQRPVLIFALVVAGLCGCADDEPARMNPPDPIENDAETIQALADTYRTKDLEAFAELLAVDYTYFLHEPDPETGVTQWDRTTELRIFHRMFDPENIPPGEPPLPGELWLQSFSLSLAQQAAFEERPDLYTNSTPPGPLDPTRWIATEARYDADVFIQLQGDTDYQLNGRCSFVVIEDRTKAIGDANKFTIYHWVDLDGAITFFKRQSLWRAQEAL